MATILLIDDDKEVLLLNKKYLTGEGRSLTLPL